MRELYDVDADVDPSRAQPVISSSCRVRPRLERNGRDDGRAAAVVSAPLASSAAGCCWRSSLAPLVGSTPISLRRAFDRSIPFADNVGRADLLRRAAAAHARRRAGRRHARRGRRRLPGPAAQPARHAVHAGRLGRRGARRDARRSPSRRRSQWLGVPVAPLASFAGSLVAVAIVYCLAHARHRGLSTNVLLLAGVTMNAFFSALILFVQYFADFAETFRTLRWLMGDLDVSSYGPLVAALPLVRRLVRGLRLAGAAAEPAQPRHRQRRDPRRQRRRARSGSRSSARRSPPAPRSRSAARSASSASSSRTWSG